MTIPPSDTDDYNDDEKHRLLAVLLILIHVACFFEMQKLSEPGHVWF